MKLVDVLLLIDQKREEGADPKGIAKAEQRIIEVTKRECTLPGQLERITKMADAQFQIIKALRPLDHKDRERVVAKLRRDFLEKGTNSPRRELLVARDALDAEIGLKQAQIDGAKAEMGAIYAEKKHIVDVANLRKDRPKYVRQLEWLERTWGGVPFREWIGTARHREMAAGISSPLPVGAFVKEMAMEFETHGAWAPLRESPEHHREFFGDCIPMMAATLDWTRTGCPIFSLTDDFFHALAVTDFGTNKEDEEDVIHMPFPAFMMNFPPNALLGDARRAFVFRVADWTPGVSTETTWPMIRLGLMSEPALFTQWSHIVTRREFLHSKDLGRNPGLGDLVSADNIALLSMARRILANMLSYIESNHGLPREKHKHGAEPAPVEREHVEPRFRVGRPVKLSPQIRQVLKEGRTGKSWKLGQRFIVRGHWRNQAVGPARSQRVRKWISPFWKGPADLTEALERRYSVEAVTVDVDVSDL